MSFEGRGRPGRYLRYARRKAGLTQVELARRVGVPQSVIGRIESGASTPRFDTLDRLLNACGYALELTPRIGRGVDRTVIGPLLNASPRERGQLAVRAAEAVDELREAAGVAP